MHVLFSLFFSKSKPAVSIKNILESQKEVPSMRVIGRGTLTMDASEARKTEKAQAFIRRLESLEVN